MSRAWSLARFCAFLLAASLAAAPALAALTAEQLAGVGVQPPPDARLPLDAPLVDLDGRATTLGQAFGGRPAVVVFTDYACTQLCSPILAVTAGALSGSGVTPGVDYRLVVIGFNPRATAADARRMVEGEIGDRALRRATTALIAAEAVANRLTAVVGYTYVYDESLRRYAHLAALFVVAGDGRVARILSGFAITDEDVRLALVEAGKGAVGGLGDQIRLLCYGFNGAVGYYVDLVRTLLAAAGAATLIGVAGGVFAASRIATRRRA